MIFGLTVMVIFAMVGAAIDVGRWMSAKNQTLAAMDSAVLAAGRAMQIKPNSSFAQIEAVARGYYDRNKSPLLTTDDVKF